MFSAYSSRFTLHPCSLWWVHRRLVYMGSVIYPLVSNWDGQLYGIRRKERESSQGIIALMPFLVNCRWQRLHSALKLLLLTASAFSDTLRSRDDNVCARAQLCLTLCNPIDCSLPGSSVHGDFQTRILEWAAISYSTASSGPRDQTCVSGLSFIGRWMLYPRATWEVPSCIGSSLLLLSLQYFASFASFY